MEPAGNRCFELLQAFARALNHELRTPLAVVSNDLHFFAGTDPSGVGAGALVQCRRMSSVLRRAAALGADPLTRHPITLGDLASAFKLPPPTTNDPVLVADPSRLTLLGALLSEIIVPPSPGAATVTLSDTTVTIDLPSASAVPTDTIERVLVETLITAFGGTLGVHAHGAGLTVSLPRVDS